MWTGDDLAGEVPLGSKEYYLLACLAENIDRYVAYPDLKHEVLERSERCGAGHDPEGAVLASDGFFPFPDGVTHAAESGVRAMVQPGGSVKDAEVIAEANRLGVAMVFTDRRVFRH